MIIIRRTWPLSDERPLLAAVEADEAVGDRDPVGVAVGCVDTVMISANESHAKNNQVDYQSSHLEHKI